MAIAEQILRVQREFVPGALVMPALMQQEKVTEVQAASWFLRNIVALDAIPMLAYNKQLNDFRVIEIPWASDIFRDALASKQLDVEWDESRDGYEGGWLSSDLRRFFARVGVGYPEIAIESLLRERPPPLPLLPLRTSSSAGDPFAKFLAQRAINFISLNDWLAKLGPDISRSGLGLRVGFDEIKKFIPLYYLETQLDAVVPHKLPADEAERAWGDLLISFALDSFPDYVGGGSDPSRWCSSIFLRPEDCDEFASAVGIEGMFSPHGSSGSLENGIVDIDAARLRLSDLERSQRKPDEVASEPEGSQIGKRERATYLNIIGGLLELMLAVTPSGKKQSQYIDQSAIIDALEANFPSAPGLKRRTLESKFAEAKRALKSL